MMPKQGYHDEQEDKVLAITYRLPSLRATVAFRPIDQIPGHARYGGVSMGDRPLPVQRMVIVPRERAAAPGPPLNLPIGRRGLVARLLGRIGERRR